MIVKNKSLRNWISGCDAMLSSWNRQVIDDKTQLSVWGQGHSLDRTGAPYANVTFFWVVFLGSCSPSTRVRREWASEDQFSRCPVKHITPRDKRGIPRLRHPASLFAGTIWWQLSKIIGPWGNQKYCIAVFLTYLKRSPGNGTTRYRIVNNTYDL